MRLLEPMGIDHWPYELALKYGVHDRTHAVAQAIRRRLIP
jgi:hypothetical protein